MSRILVGPHNFMGGPKSISMVGGAPATAAERGRLISTLFAPLHPNLIALPPLPDVQLVGADADGDGDEDKTLIQWLPLTGTSGSTVAIAASVDLELKPLRMCTILDIEVDVDIGKKFVVTSFFVGAEDQFVAKGAIPLSVFAHDATFKQMSTQLAGPGVPITLTLKNISGAEAILWGGARVLSIVG
jgi:hypothetical protein